MTEIRKSEAEIKEKLDVSKNINLEDLGIGDNPIESIDVSANENLKALTCGWSKMKALDLSHNPNLDRLAIDETPRGNMTLDGLMSIVLHVSIIMGAMIPKTIIGLWMNWLRMTDTTT